MGLLSGLVDTVFGDGARSAAQAKARAYGQAMGMMAPYRQRGMEDYDKFRAEISNFGKSLQGYGNPYEWGWSKAGESPLKFYDELLSGYTETPEAKYLRDQLMKTVTQGASAAGTLGSGAMYKELQDRSSDIVKRDIDRFLQNVLNVNQRQMDYGNNYQGQQALYRSGLSSLADVGTNATNNMSQLAIGRGQAEAEARKARATGWDNLINMGTALLF